MCSLGDNREVVADKNDTSKNDSKLENHIPSGTQIPLKWSIRIVGRERWEDSVGSKLNILETSEDDLNSLTFHFRCWNNFENYFYVFVGGEIWEKKSGEIKLNTPETSEDDFNSITFHFRCWNNLENDRYVWSEEKVKERVSEVNLSHKTNYGPGTQNSNLTSRGPSKI